MRPGLGLLLAVLVLWGGAGNDAHAAPQAGPQIWTLDIKPGPLRLHVDPIDGKHYHYFTYQVVNSTKADRMFAPTIELFTDKGEILKSGDGVPSIPEIWARLLFPMRMLSMISWSGIFPWLFSCAEHADTAKASTKTPVAVRATLEKGASLRRFFFVFSPKF